MMLKVFCLGMAVGHVMAWMAVFLNPQLTTRDHYAGVCTWVAYLILVLVSIGCDEQWPQMLRRLRR